MGVGIEVRGLNAWYGKNQALNSIDMTVAANHVTAVIGPSGCGKSTYVRCLNRMHETIPEAHAEGLVKVGEMDVYGSGSDPVEVRRRIGMVFQKPNPFPTMSVYGNVAAGLKLNGFRNRKQMDEPASALDPISTSKIEELIFQLKQHYTVVIVTHNMQQAARVAEFTGFFLMGSLIEYDLSLIHI